MTTTPDRAVEGAETPTNEMLSQWLRRGAPDCGAPETHKVWRDLAAERLTAVQPPALQTVSDEDWQRALDCACSYVDKKFISRAALDNAMQHAFGMLSLRASPPAQLQGEAVAWGRPHVEYSASRGQSRVEFWVSREDGRRIESGATPADAIARERGILEALQDWCATERHNIGAVDGYDYRSGEEYGLRCAEIEIQKAIRALSRTASLQGTGGRE